MTDRFSYCSAFLSALAVQCAGTGRRAGRFARLVGLVGAVALVLSLGACTSDPGSPAGLPDGEGRPRSSPEADVHPVLDAHTAEFERRIVPVTDGVWVAVGFGLANSILVEGRECAFVVDTMGSLQAASDVREEFSKLTTKPIRALVYTHNHADHVFGSPAFASTASGGPGSDGAAATDYTAHVGDSLDVYAHRTTQSHVERVVGVIRPIIARRSARMFGGHLPKEGPNRFVNAGIGPVLEIGLQAEVGFLPPTHLVDGVMDTEICSVPVRLRHAPGETDDQIFVWLPDHKVLMPGDNIYKAFPNLYTIRGTPYRDVLDWVASLDAMRRLGAEFLVPSHTGPVAGKAEIEETLRAYRDAIQFVHDQTVRRMNEGMLAGEVVDSVRLPAHLAAHPYLQELYGTVAWSVRSIYQGYLGWFEGDAAALDPDPSVRRAGKLAALAGGQEGLLAAASEALADTDYRWAAELSAEYLHLDPGNASALGVRAAALEALGRQSVSANGRNYYITQAAEARGDTVLEDDASLIRRSEGFLEQLPIESFLRAMTVYLNPERAVDADLVIRFDFTEGAAAGAEVGEPGEGGKPGAPGHGAMAGDAFLPDGRIFTMHVRGGVAVLNDPAAGPPDVTVRTQPLVWKRVAAGLDNPAVALATGRLRLSGGFSDLLGFLRMFER